MIAGKHVQRGTNRRLSYRALYELIGTRLYITASVRCGDRTLASPDLEACHRPETGSADDAVVAALVRYINDTTFDLGRAPDTAGTPPAGDAASGARAPSARSAWAQLRANDLGPC